MRQLRKRTLYRQLVARFLLFLALPLFLMLAFLSAKILFEGKKNYEERLALITDYATGVRMQQLSAVEKIEKRIISNESLKGFFLVKYTPGDLTYYSSAILNMLKPGPEESIYSVRVYFPNETIPRGFGTCYRLSDFAQKDAALFLDSDAEDYWVMPEEAGRYSSLYTPYARSYTHMVKVWGGDKLAYILTVSVPEESMDAFLYEDLTGSRYAAAGHNESESHRTQGGSGIRGKGGEPGGRTVAISREAVTLDYSGRGRHPRREEFSMPGFPQKLVFLFGPDVWSRYVAVIIATVMLLTVALVVFLLRFQLLKLTLKQAALLKDTQLMALQHQINPHFLYNALEVFSYKMELYHHEEEAEAIVSLSRLLRYNVAESNGYAALAEELKQVDHYLCIQRMKYREIEFENRIDQKYLCAEVPRFLLQPLIENSIVHGYCGRPLSIVLSCAAEEGFLRFEIWDNGKGMAGEEEEALNKALQSTEAEGRPGAIGIGLNNINSRLRLLYADACRITVESREMEFTKLSFRIPVQEGFYGNDVRRKLKKGKGGISSGEKSVSNEGNAASDREETDSGGGR